MMIASSRLCRRAPRLGGIARWVGVALVGLVGCERLGYAPLPASALGNTLPRVSLQAQASEISEGDGFSLTASLDAPAETDLDVTLFFGGTATFGDDYTGPTALTIAAGARSLDVTYTSVEDISVEALETIVISVVGDAAVQPGAPSTVTVGVRDIDGHRSRITVDGGSVCALHGGEVYCWGEVLWQGFSSTPTLVPELGTGNIGVMGRGRSRSCSLTPTESRCINAFGLVSSAQLVGPRAWDSSGAHECILDDQGVLCGGVNHFGQLGDRTQIDQEQQIRVAGLPANLATVATAYQQSCAYAPPDIYCWGLIPGRGTTLDPTIVATMSEPIEALVGIADVICIIQNGSARCQDSGTGTFEPVTDLGGGVTDLAGGFYHFCAVRLGGLECSGSNRFGQMGQADLVDSLPWSPVTGLAAVEDFDADAFTSCAVTSGGVYCWGHGGDGGLGDRRPLVEATPVSVGAAQAGLLAMSRTQLCSLGDDAALRCAGNNDLASLPLPERISYPVLTAAVGLPTSPAEAVALGPNFGCGVFAGALWCWGAGGLPLQSGSDYFAPPGPVALVPDSVSDVAVGLDSACVIRSADGSVACWGFGGVGQLGTGSVVPESFVPTSTAPALSGITLLAAGDWHLCASDGSGVWCWGWNMDGQIGQEPIGDVRPAPVAVAGLPGGVVSDLASGVGHSCAIVDGDVYCWGGDWSGQLGEANANQGGASTTPVEITGLPAGQVTAIAASGTVSCAVGAGRLYCWGDGSRGQLGDGNVVVLSRTPIEVLLPAGTVTAVTAAPYTVCATIDVTSGPAGSIYCWGMSRYGERADGVSAISTTPLLVNLP